MSQNHNVLMCKTVNDGHFLPIFVYRNPQLIINYSQLYKSINYKIECIDRCVCNIVINLIKKMKCTK